LDLNLNILWQNEHYPDTLLGGGGAVTTHNIVTNFVRIGHKVMILARNHNGSNFQEELIDGIHIMKHPEPRIPKRAWIIRAFIEGYYLGSVIGDIVKSHDIFFCIDPEYVVAIKRILPKQPVICRVEGTLRGYNSAVPGYKQASAMSLKERVYSALLFWEKDFMDKVLMHRCDAIVVKSKQMKDEVSSLYNIPLHKIHVIYNGIDFIRFACARPKVEVLKEINNLDKMKIIITSCGRLNRMKNMGFLIQGFLKMRQKGNCLLLIIGDGEERNILETMVKENGIYSSVRFIGHQKNVEDYFAVSDVFALTSTYEPFGNVWVEAMAAGLPCLGLEPNYKTVRVGSSEIINHGETGYLVNPNDPSELAERLDELAANPVLRRKMGEKGQKFCKEKFDWQKSAREYLMLAEGLLEKSNSSRDSEGGS